MLTKKRTTRSSFKLLVLAMSIIVLGMPSAQAQKYSDWSPPVNLGSAINSTFSDQQPAISKDGLSLYFTSNRPGGVGSFDMYVSQRASVYEPWSSPFHATGTSCFFKVSVRVGWAE